MGVTLIASLIVSAALAVWMLIQTLSGSSVESVPRTGERIDASFAGLRDTRGAAVDEHALATRYRLVTFGFTTCPNVCPLTLMGVHQALEQLGPDAARILPVFVSVDPQRDTPRALSAYVNAFDARIVALTGSPRAVERVAQQYRIFFGGERSMVSPDLTRWNTARSSCWLIRSNGSAWRFHPLPHRLRLPPGSSGPFANQLRPNRAGSSASDLISRSGLPGSFSGR